MLMPIPLIEIKNLSKSYGTPTAVALKSAQFAVGWALAQQQIQANNPKHVLLLSMACHF